MEEILAFLHSQHGLKPPSCEKFKWGNVPKLKPTDVELKPFFSNDKYVFINPPYSLPVMIVSGLHETKEEKLLRVFRDKRETYGWNIHDMKGLEPTLCMHKINTTKG